MDFEIIGKILWIETTAVGHSIREIRRLKRIYGETTGENVKELLK
jgi:hypothetical protein